MHVEALSDLYLAPVIVPHSVLVDNVKIGGYDFPKDSIIIPHLYAAFMDPKLYPDPHRFDPERFLNDSGQLYKTETVIPFSAGSYKCTCLLSC